MSQNIIDNILLVYNNLTKSQKQVADYVLQHQTETQFMTISELSSACKVADSTITYFCKALGCGGFNEFKLSLAQKTNSDNQTHTLFDTNIVSTDSITMLGSKLFQNHQNAIAQTLEMLDPTSISNAVDLICNARNVYCFGQGASSVIALEAYTRFSYVTLKFHWVQDSHLQNMTCSLLTAEDVILYFSYSGSTNELIDLSQLASKNQVPIILVTRFQNSPGAHYAKIILLCGSNESPLHQGSISARVAQLFLIDIIFNEFCRRNPDVSLEARERTIQAITHKLT